MKVVVQAALGAAATSMLALGVSTAATAARVDGPTVHWNFAMYGPKRAVTFGFEELARILAAETDGKFKLDIHLGGTLAPEKEMIDGLHLGAYEMTLVVSSFVPGKLPVTEGLGLPFLPQPTTRHVRAVREAFYSHPGPQRELARWTASYVMPVPLGANEFVGKGRPPLTLEGWKGLRVRALAGVAKTMRGLGALAQNIPTSEVYGALERGIIDAASASPYALVAFKAHETTNWYTSNMNVSVGPSVIVGNTKSIEALPPQYKKLLIESSKRATDEYVKVIAVDDDKALELFKSLGMTEVRYSPQQLDELHKIARPVWKEWVDEVTQKGYPGEELLQIMLTAAKNVT